MQDVGDVNVTLEQGVEIVDKQYVQGIITYLKTKVLKKSHTNYITCYS